MVKGNICERCQGRQATGTLDIKGWRKWTVCKSCYQELSVCAKCKKNPVKYLLDDGKGGKVQVCENCDKEDSKCQWCQDPNGSKIRYGDHVSGTESSYKECELYLCKSCNEVYNDASKKGKVYHECWTCQKKSTGVDSILEDKKDEKFNEAGICQDCLSKKGDKPNDKGGEFCQKCKKKSHEELWKVENLRTKQTLMVCDDCDKNERGNKKDKPTDKGKEPKPDEICEGCGVSCKKLIFTDKEKVTQTYRIVRKRITHWYTDFRKTVNYFGMDCSCAEEFKKKHQQTCPQCQKTEWPDMKKGWLLDYEIHKSFCSPLCHVTYRQLKWEEANNLTQVEMPPPELELSTNEGQNTDWEKEGLKREVLFWRTYAKELEQRLNNQSNLTPEERQQSNYLRNLQQNTLRNAESNYQSRYGTLNEDGSDKGKGMSRGMIALIVIGIVIVVGGIIFLLTRNKNKKIK